MMDYEDASSEEEVQEAVPDNMAFLFQPEDSEVDPDLVTGYPYFDQRTNKLRFRSVTQFARHVVTVATNGLFSRPQTLQLRQGLALAPTNAVSVQRSILEAYRSMFARFLVNICFAVSRPDGQGRTVDARGILVELDVDILKVFGWSVCSEFLQLFGKQMRELVIYYTNIDRGYYRSVQDMVDNWCIRNGNLIQIEFRMPRKFPIEGPFENRIRNVYIDFTNSFNYMGETPIAKLADYFPHIKLLLLEGVLAQHRVKFDPVEIRGLRTLVIIAGEELSETNSTKFVEFLEKNPQLENLIINRNVINSYGVDPLMVVLFRKMRKLEELILINCVMEVNDDVLSFVTYHDSLKRFQFGIHEGESTLNLLERASTLRTEGEMGVSYEATCLPNDEYRLNDPDRDHRVFTVNKIDR